MNEERLGPLSHPGWYHYSSWAFKGFTEFLDFFISWFEPNGFASRTQSTKLGHPLRREQHHRHDLIEMRVSTVPVPVPVPKRERVAQRSVEIKSNGTDETRQRQGSQQRSPGAKWGGADGGCCDGNRFPPISEQRSVSGRAAYRSQPPRPAL